LKSKKKTTKKTRRKDPCSCEPKQPSKTFIRLQKRFQSYLKNLLSKYKKYVTLDIYLEAYHSTFQTADTIFKDLPEKQKTFALVYRENSCHITKACEAVGIMRCTFYDWIKKNKNFKTVIQEINESDLDFAESILKKLVREERWDAVKFYLERMGKHRGYVERHEIAGVAGQEIDVRVRIIKGDRKMK
jgi:hypothetical protein